MIDCTILYMIVTGTLDEKALHHLGRHMTYVCFYYRQIYHIYIYIVLSKIPFIKNGIFTTSLPQLDVFAGTAPNCGCQLLRDFQAALRGEKYHEALDAAERAIALTGGRTHWVSTTGNRREVVGCSEGPVFFCYQLGSTSKVNLKKWKVFFRKYGKHWGNH